MEALYHWLGVAFVGLIGVALAASGGSYTLFSTACAGFVGPRGALPAILTGLFGLVLGVALLVVVGRTM